MSDMLSDVKSFTVRDMDRTPADILRVCDAEGLAVIRSRSGRTYEIRPAVDSGEAIDKATVRQWLQRHRAWTESTFPRKIPASQYAEVDRLLAGE
jgi:hypothetical protein